MSINILPIELKKEILGFLDPKDQAKASCTDESLNQAATLIFQEKMKTLVTFIEDCDKQLQKIYGEHLITPYRSVLDRERKQRVVSSIHPLMIQDMLTQKATPQFYAQCREKVIDALADCRFSDLEKITTDSSIELLQQAKNTIKGSFYINYGKIVTKGGSPSCPYSFSGEEFLALRITVSNRESDDWCALLSSRVNQYFEHGFPSYLPENFLKDKKEGDSFYLSQLPSQSEIRIKLTCNQISSPDNKNATPFQKVLRGNNNGY